MIVKMTQGTTPNNLIVDVHVYLEGSGDPKDEHQIMGIEYVYQSGRTTRFGWWPEPDEYVKEV